LSAGAVTVLALDLATCTGWACDGPPDARGNPRPFGGSFELRGSAYGDRYVDLRDRLVDMIAVHRPDVGVFEAPLPFAGGSNFAGASATSQTVRLLLGLAAVAEETLTRAGLAVYEVNVQQVRKHFCGDPRAKKDDVMRVCRTLGWNASDNNAADAMAAWDMARAALKLGGAPRPILAGVGR
jgi:Holliday junction resolvasome RuvABC endonuclease subunit